MAKDPSFTLLLALASRVAEDESDYRTHRNLKRGSDRDGEIGAAAPASTPVVSTTGRNCAQAPSEQSDAIEGDSRAMCRESTGQPSAPSCNSNSGGFGVLSVGVRTKLAKSSGDGNGLTDTTAVMPGSPSSVHTLDLTAATTAKDNAGLARAGSDSVVKPSESIGIATGAAGGEMSQAQTAAKENVHAPAVISPTRPSGPASASPRCGSQRQQSSSTHPIDEACDLVDMDILVPGKDVAADASGEQVAIPETAAAGESKMTGLSVRPSPVNGRERRKAIPSAAWELHGDDAGEEIKGATGSPPQSTSHDVSIATAAGTPHVTLRVGSVRDVPRLSASALGIFHEGLPPPPDSETDETATTNSLAEHQEQGDSSSFAAPGARSSLLSPSNETRKSKVKDRRPRALQALADSAEYARAIAKAACTTSSSPESRRGTKDRRRRRSAVDCTELSRRNIRSRPASAADSICASAGGRRLDGKRQQGTDEDSSKSKRGSTERSPAPEKRRNVAKSGAVCSPPGASGETNSNGNKKQRKRRREADMLADSPTFCSPAASTCSPSTAGGSSSERRTRRRCTMEDGSLVTPVGEGKSLAEKFRPLGTFATPALLPSLSVTSVRGVAAGWGFARSSVASSRVDESEHTNVAGEDASGGTCLGSGGRETALESSKRCSSRPNGAVDLALEGAGAAGARTADVDSTAVRRRTSPHQQQPPKLFLHAPSTAVYHSRAPRHSRTD